MDRIDVSEGPTFSGYKSNGRDIRVRYPGFAGSAPAVSIPSSTITLTGGTSSFSFPSNYAVPVSTNILYEPIPYELLYSAEQLPSISLTVKNLAAACPAFNCNYDYTVTTSEITSTTLTGNTLTIVATDPDLQTSILTDIMFSNTACTNPSTSPT
jgi:hypothetical protein